MKRNEWKRIAIKLMEFQFYGSESLQKNVADATTTTTTTIATTITNI